MPRQRTALLLLLGLVAAQAVSFDSLKDLVRDDCPNCADDPQNPDTKIDTDDMMPRPWPPGGRWWPHPWHPRPWWPDHCPTPPCSLVCAADNCFCQCPPLTE